MEKHNAGYLVKTTKGKIGRTYHSKGLVNNKVPVYLADIEDSEQDAEEVGDISNFKTVAILCEPSSLTRIGFID